MVSVQWFFPVLSPLLGSTKPLLFSSRFHNGRPLATGHRFKTYFDFGYVALDILYTFPEDTGVFEVRATNRLGTDVLRKEVTVQCKDPCAVLKASPYETRK